MILGYGLALLLLRYCQQTSDQKLSLVLNSVHERQDGQRALYATRRAGSSQQRSVYATTNTHAHY